MITQWDKSIEKTTTLAFSHVLHPILLPIYSRYKYICFLEYIILFHICQYLLNLYSVFSFDFAICTNAMSIYINISSETIL